MKNFSLIFIISIILIKIIYLYFESDYNAHLIDIVSDPNATQEILNNLEKYGHRLSSIGLTLLIIPFIYSILKKIVIIEKYYLAIFVLITILVYNLTYNTLTQIIDEFVKRNQHLQYNSYYTTMFKYGMLKNEMGYSSFVPKERLENLSIEDKVMISNIFLLVELDKELIKKVVENKDNTIQTILINEKDNRFQESYKKSENQFNNKLKEFDNRYNDYVLAYKNSNQKLIDLDNEKALNKAYDNFKDKLNIKYQEYMRQSDIAKNKSYPNDEETEKYYKDLKDYFKYQKYEKAKNKYMEQMNKNFGGYIEPSRWCYNDICPSKEMIKIVINEEVERNWRKRMGSIPRNLSLVDFLKFPQIKQQVISELKNQGLIVADDFNYSKASFSKAYQNKLISSSNKISTEFKNEIYKKIGKNIDIGLSYEEFVNHWKEDIIKEYGKKYGEILFNMIKNKSSKNYYEDFYEPYFKDTVGKNYLISEKQFEDKEDNQKGTYAIKSMFVVPFAIFMSLFAGVLNFISVIVLSSIVLLRFIKNERKSFIISNILRLILLFTLIYYPYKIGKNNNLLEQYKILENKEISNDFIRYYVEVLNWILVVEKINYNHINKN